MPNSHQATKPGDVFTAKNGKTIQVDNTDAEGRLILADALTYADTLNPKLVIDVATLTGAMAVAIGGCCIFYYFLSYLFVCKYFFFTFCNNTRIRFRSLFYLRNLLEHNATSLIFYWRSSLENAALELLYPINEKYK